MRGGGSDAAVAGEGHQVAIPHAGIEADAPVLVLAGQFLVQRVDESVGLLVADVSGGVVFHFTVSQRYQVAAEDAFVGTDLEPLCDGLQRRAPRVVRPAARLLHRQE